MMRNLTTLGFVKELSKQVLISSKYLALALLTVTLINLGNPADSYAQVFTDGTGYNLPGTDGPGTGVGTGTGAGGGQVTNVGNLKDGRIYCVMMRILTLIEGNGGALLMIGAGIATVISAAFGAFKAATSLFAVAASAFVLRSVVVIFFNVSAHDAGNCAPGQGIQGGAAPA